MTLQSDRAQGGVDALADFAVRYGEILWSERHVVLEYGGDDLVFGFLEYRADAAAGRPVGFGVRAVRRSEYRHAQQSHRA